MKRKILTSCIVLAILSIAICQIVNAVSFTPAMTPSSSSVKEETEFTINLKISNLDAGNGINKVVATLDYDTNVLDEINESNIEGLNNWVATYDSLTKVITLTKDTFVKDNQDILKISLKTKEGTSGEKTTISLKNIKATCSESDITGNDISTTITIGDARVTLSGNNSAKNNVISTTNNITNNSLNNKTNNTINATRNTSNSARNSINSIINANTSNSSTVASNTVPYTGVNDTIAGVIIALVAIALVFYFKIEKINEDLK